MEGKDFKRQRIRGLASTHEETAVSRREVKQKSWHQNGMEQEKGIS